MKDTNTRERHGMSDSKEYNSWMHMRSRCINKKHPKFPDYGGRGIKVCDRWRNSFVAFYSDMGPKPSNLHTIERIDNDGDYTPDNCKWATPTAQARNTRLTTYITHPDGRTLCLSEWAELLNVKPVNLHVRLQRGWSHEETLTRPFNRRGGYR